MAYSGRMANAQNGMACRRALLVLGMHRSGTSLLAHMLQALGAVLPADVIGPGHGNPQGHWEPRRLVALNDEILQTLSRGWDDPRPIDPDWFDSDSAGRAVGRIAETIVAEYGGAKLLLIKDPRICRLAPLYLRALARLDIRPHAVLAVRPCAEVARSLQKREGFDKDISEYLWIRSILEAERATRHYRRSWVHFHHLLADWRKVARGIFEDAGLDTAAITGEQAARIDTYIDTSGERKSTAGGGAPKFLTARIWLAVEQALAGDSGNSCKELDLAAAYLEDFDRLQGSVQTRREAVYEARLEAMLRSTSWRITRPLRALKRRKT